MYIFRKKMWKEKLILYLLFIYWQRAQTRATYFQVVAITTILALQKAPYMDRCTFLHIVIDAVKRPSTAGSSIGVIVRKSYKFSRSGDFNARDLFRRPVRA